ncbi:MAG: GntR family transcriptional regulator, partial [Defluviitaleaceae bacterium]|nr:GntR family transcriptional regulator [Defluviitaleaceae bacterium]
MLLYEILKIAMLDWWSTMELNKTPLGEQIYKQIKKDIIECNLEFGEKLINRSLQNKYGVSSTPIRDAINHLYLDGLVDNITNSGAQIISFDLQFMLEVNEMASMLCCASVDFCSQRADNTALCKQLEEVLRVQQESIGDEFYYEYDYLFHKTFFDHCQNTQFAKNFARYHTLMEMMARRFHSFHDNKHNSLAQHKQIFKLYCDGAIEDAIEQTRSHYFDATKQFCRYMQ